MIAVVLLALSISGAPNADVDESSSAAAMTATSADAGCRDVLDAREDETTRCASPQQVPAAIEPDATDTATQQQARDAMRDPSVVPGELGFAAVVLTSAAAGSIFAGLVQSPGRLDQTGNAIRSTQIVGGYALLGVAALVGAGGVATWVFDPSTGRLRLPLFLPEENG